MGILDKIIKDQEKDIADNEVTVLKGGAKVFLTSDIGRCKYCGGEII
jgi:hypothetical protein